MAVSGAGGAEGAPEGQAGEQQPGGEAAQGQQQAGLPEAFETRFNDFEQRFGAVPDQLAQLMQAVTAAGEGEGEPGGLQQEANSPFILGADGQVYDLRTGQLANPADLAGGEELSAEQIDQRIQDQAQRIAQEAVAPVLAEQRAQQLAALEDTYAEMRDPKVAQSIVQEARRMAERVGAPEAWRDPEVLEQTYLAMKARERAGQEDPATGRVDTELEQPGAGGAQGLSPEDEAKEIVNAGGGGGFFGV
jgi:hypothetical protein